MNESLARLSDLAFEAALAGYVVALVCYAVELAARRGGDAAVVAAAARGATARGAAVLTVDDRGAIGVLAPPPVAPWGVRFGRAAVAVTVIGLAANVVSIVARGLAVDRLPLGNMYEFTSAICAVAVACWLVVLARTGARTLGVFVLLPVVLLAFLAGTVLYTPAAPVVPALNSYWKWIHVTTVAISSSVLLVSGAASVLFLLRGRVERRTASATSVSLPGSLPGSAPVSAPGSASASTSGATADSGPGPAADRSGAASGGRGAGSGMPGSTGAGGLLARLPSLATLDRIAYRTAIIAFPVYTFAVIAGAMWAEVAWGRYWGWDPKETCAFVTWVVYAAYLHARSTAGWRGRPAAWISVVGFATIMFNLFVVNMVVSGLHSYAGLN